jgi:uncharacterized membrane protein
MNAKRVMLAAAAAALFTAGVTASSAQAEHHEKSETVECKGVNACKGQTDCGTASHDCSGKNECKGKGWKKMTAEECDKAKAEMGA